MFWAFVAKKNREKKSVALSFIIQVSMIYYKDKAKAMNLQKQLKQ